MPTRLSDLFTYVLLLGVLILAFFGMHGCAAVPVPRAPKWSDRIPATAAVQLRGEHFACSGVAISDHELLTAAHCVNKGDFEVVAFPGVSMGLGEVMYVDSGQDRARVRVPGLLTVQAPIAHKLPEEGDLVFAAGFGCYGSLAVTPGLYLDATTASGQLGLAVGVCHGDSGGPVFNELGEVFAVMSAKATDVPLAVAADVRGF